jgi:hypothetical protein
MKNLKRSAFGLSFLIALLCLQGCYDATISREHTEKYLRACNNNGGVKELNINTNYAKEHVIDKVFCNDGAVFDSIVVNKKT